MVHAPSVHDVADWLACRLLLLLFPATCHSQEAASSARTAAPASKQLDPKKALQQRKEQEQHLQQQMQQRKPGGRDTERARDTKRSKPAQDDKHQQELDAARNKEKEAKEDAAKVWAAARAQQFGVACLQETAVKPGTAGKLAGGLQAMSTEQGRLDRRVCFVPASTGHCQRYTRAEQTLLWQQCR